MVPNAVARAAARVLCHRRARAALTLACAGVIGCRSDAPTAAGPPVALQRVSGNGQSAPPGTSLDRPLVARLVDADGRPVRRVEVHWTVSAGSVTPDVSTTDANGNATTVWQLGAAMGVQRAIATAEGLDAIEFVAFVDPKALPERIPLRAIPLSTYDGSGQVVHPDVVLPFGAANDPPARLAVTPYPWGNANFENPSLFVGDGRDGWSVPDGLTNPVVRPSEGYFSDPDLLWVEDAREFRLYYRRVDTDNVILLTQSADGVRWGDSRVVLRARSHTAVSPSVVRRSPSDWLMWTVNSGSAGCSSSTTSVEVRRSTDGVSWSAPTTVSMSQPGVYPWHLEVQWIPSLHEYWALFNGKVAGSCTTDALYLATSSDGIAWRTYASPVLRRGAIPELADVVYRATFAYDPERDLVSIWHSGARYASRGYEWRAAFERRRRGELFDAVGRVTAAMTTPSTAPPLTNATAP